MHPTLFKTIIAGREIEVVSYTFFTGIAALLVVALGTITASRRGLGAAKSAACLVAGSVFTLIGGRVIHWLTNPKSFYDNHTLFTLSAENFSIYAGLFIGVPATIVVARIVKVNAWRLADAVTPALALAAASAKVGCFCAGCCYGKPTALPWSISVAAGSNAHGSQLLSGEIGFLDSPLPVHPVQLYEAIAALAGFFVAVWILRRGLAEGSAFLWFMAFFSMFRLFNRMFIYPLPNFIAPQWLFGVVYSIVAVGCVWVAVRRRTTYSNK